MVGAPPAAKRRRGAPTLSKCKKGWSPYHKIVIGNRMGGTKILVQRIFRISY